MRGGLRSVRGLRRVGQLRSGSSRPSSYHEDGRPWGVPGLRRPRYDVLGSLGGRDRRVRLGSEQRPARRGRDDGLGRSGRLHDGLGGQRGSCPGSHRGGDGVRPRGSSFSPRRRWGSALDGRPGGLRAEGVALGPRRPARVGTIHRGRRAGCRVLGPRDSRWERGGRRVRGGSRRGLGGWRRDPRRRASIRCRRCEWACATGGRDARRERAARCRWAVIGERGGRTDRPCRRGGGLDGCGHRGRGQTHRLGAVVGPRVRHGRGWCRCDRPNRAHGRVGPLDRGRLDHEALRPQRLLEPAPVHRGIRAVAVRARRGSGHAAASSGPMCSITVAIPCPTPMHIVASP